MAPNTSSRRSVSTSSASTSTSKSSVDGIKKKFGCSHPGCGKLFSRSEHLHRHALNHKDGENTCPRCSAHFRRRDLLDRHMIRHKEKDDEAGGEGLGLLATRKRLWRDEDGKIVNARRPSYTKEGGKRRSINRKGPKTERGNEGFPSRQAKLSMLPSPPVTMPRVESTDSSAIIVDAKTRRYTDTELKTEDEIEQDSWLQINTSLPSPLISASSEDESPDGELDTLYEDIWPLTHHGLPEIINNSPVLERRSEYPESPSWGPQPFQTFMGAMGELPYDDIFKPETGLYDWQAWNSQVLMSRCREEKFEPYAEGERKSYLGQETGFKRGFGLGTC